MRGGRRERDELQAVASAGGGDNVPGGGSRRGRRAGRSPCASARSSAARRRRSSCLPARALSRASGDARSLRWRRCSDHPDAAGRRARLARAGEGASRPLLGARRSRSSSAAAIARRGRRRVEARTQPRPAPAPRAKSSSMARPTSDRAATRARGRRPRRRARSEALEPANAGLCTEVVMSSSGARERDTAEVIADNVGGEAELDDPLGSRRGACGVPPRRPWCSGAGARLGPEGDVTELALLGGGDLRFASAAPPVPLVPSVKSRRSQPPRRPASPRRRMAARCRHPRRASPTAARCPLGPRGKNSGLLQVEHLRRG